MTDLVSRLNLDPSVRDVAVTAAGASGGGAAGEANLADLRAVVEVDTDPARYPHAAEIVNGVAVYDTTTLREALTGVDSAAAARNELAAALADGPGVIAIRGAIDGDVVDRASAVFEQILTDERTGGIGGGDHYAKEGANERIWNALEKFAVADPDCFVDYHGSDMIDLAAMAWLGPSYQMTAQINVINPGGEAQSPHRDYHLGFMTDEMAQRYPVHAHRLSPVLTLQGAVAHCDISPEAGATMVLPHSQRYDLGYLLWRRPELMEYFARHHVQLPLAKGDLLFFNPAVIHAGGHNRTADVRRMANLLQISSAMGRIMETVDRDRMVRALYPTLLARHQSGFDPYRLACAIAASAEGYAFPTNLDRDKPVGGRLTPPSQQDLVHESLADGIDPIEFATRLGAYNQRRLTH